MSIRRILSFLLLAVLLCGFGARAEQAAEPTVDQVYQAAKGGDLPGARAMIDQVVAKHPNSGKAHYVKAEIAAAQRDRALARDELATAERLAPGLPFAKPQSVSALRADLDRPAATPPARTSPPPAREAKRMGAPASEGGGFPFGWLLVVGIGVFVFIAWRGARKRAEEQRAMMASPPAEPFGRYPEPGAPGAAPYGAPPYGAPQPGYPPPQPGYPQQQPSMGGSIARGLGAGLAFGAGAAAANEIGHRIFDHDRGNATGGHPAMGNQDAGANADSPLARDAGLGALAGRPEAPPDFGGNDFGVDPGGWDDAGMDAGDVGGNDWDT